MPRRLTMLDLRTRCLQQCDLEADAAFSSVSLTNAMMSAQYGDLYSVSALTGLRYFESSLTFTTTGVNTLAEPVDHLATVDVLERIIDPVTGRRLRLRQIQAQERAMWSGKTGHARRWELADDQIYLYPTPPAGDQYVLRYIPQPPDLTAYGDSQVVDVVTPDGESFMIWGFCVRALGKLKSDATLAIAEREAARERLTEWASLRAFNDPPRIIADEDDPVDYPYRDGSWWYDR